MRESGRWLDGLRAAERTLASTAMVTVVADCESDIYDLFAAPRAGHVHLLVRAEHDRCLEGDRLFAEMAASPPVAVWSITVPAKPGRPSARRAWRQLQEDRDQTSTLRPHQQKSARDDRAHGDQVAEVDPPRRAADRLILSRRTPSRTPKTLRASCAGIGRAGRSSRYSARSRPRLRSDAARSRRLRPWPNSPSACSSPLSAPCNWFMPVRRRPKAH